MRFMSLLFLICLSVNSLAFAGSTTTFLKGLLRNPKEVSAFSPCSSSVAKEISSIIAHKDGEPLRILEVGGGTGALTAGIVKRMQSGDICDVIELIPEYCNVLEKDYGHVPGVTVHCCSILDWHPEQPYDLIICSLPLNTFEVKFLDAVLSHLKNVLKSPGKMSYVELMWISEWKRFFLLGESRRKLTATLNHMQEFRAQYINKTVPIYWNFTPLAVHHLEIA